MKPSKLTQTKGLKPRALEEKVKSKPKEAKVKRPPFKITNPYLRVIISDIKRLLHIKEVDSGERWSDWKDQL